jgi:hypothetical protein
LFAAVPTVDWGGEVESLMPNSMLSGSSSAEFDDELEVTQYGVLDDGLDGVLDRTLEGAANGVLACKANGQLERMLDGTFDGCMKGN